MTSQMYRYPEYDPFYNNNNGEEIFDKFGNMIDKMATEVDSETKWVSATIIACAISITAVIIRWLMKNEQTNTITYSPIHTGVRNLQVSPISDQHIAVTIPPVQQGAELKNMSSSRDKVRGFDRLFRVFQILGKNMERFLQDMIRGRPIRFSHQDIIEFTHNLSSSLGSGGYGEIYKGTFPNGVTIAVKVLKDKLLDKKTEDQFVAEATMLARTNHVNLVRVYGFCFDPTMSALVYEYMDNESLDKLLFDENKQVEWQKLRQISIGLAKGLAYLHEYCKPEIIHYHIKPRNVLLDSNLNPKISDFGLARLCNQESNVESSQTSTTRSLLKRAYDAPELFMENIPVTNKCDVYSFGLLLLEIIARRRNYNPHEGSDGKEILVERVWRLWENGKLIGFFSEYDHIEDQNKQEANRMLMVVLMCVQNDPNKRPSMSNVVKMLEGENEINPPSNPFIELLDGEASVLPDESKEKSNNFKTNGVLELELKTIPENKSIV